MAGGAWLGFALQAHGTTALRARITPAVATRRVSADLAAVLSTPPLHGITAETSTRVQ